MLIVAFFANNGVWSLYALLEKMGKFNNFPRFRALFGIIIRAMALENICEVRWHVVSIVFFLNFCGETAEFSTFQ